MDGISQDDRDRIADIGWQQTLQAAKKQQATKPPVTWADLLKAA